MKLIERLGGETRQTFDTARRLTSVTNAAGHPVERYEYDAFGRLVTVRDALQINGVRVIDFVAHAP